MAVVLHLALLYLVAKLKAIKVVPQGHIEMQCLFENWVTRGGEPEGELRDAHPQRTHPPTVLANRIVKAASSG
jgi:hypothetical protein